MKTTRKPKESTRKPQETPQGIPLEKYQENGQISKTQVNYFENCVTQK